MESNKKYTKVKKIKKENKFIKVILKIVVVLLIIAAIIVLAKQVYKHLKAPTSNNDNIISNETTEFKSVTGKLADYITGLGNSYYIRYTGEFGNASLNENPIQATVEYTQKGIETAIYSEALEMNVVTDLEYAYNISHKYKMIFKARLPVLFNTQEYNLISDFGQQYVADVKTNVVGVDYIYQEYEYEDAKIRYYFVDDDLRYIRVVVGNNDRKINIRVDRHTKQELFNIPEGYNLQNM